MTDSFIYDDWGKACPKTASRPGRDNWWIVPFTTAERSGTLVSAFHTCCPEDLVVAPALSGWHRIYICMMLAENNVVEIRLSGDSCFDRLTPIRDSGWDEYTLEESFWRCADLTVQSIRITRSRFIVDCSTVLAWLRFEPMTEAEVAAWKAAFSHPKDKRLYASNDMASSTTFCYRMEKQADWRSVLAQYRDSDIAWVGLEHILTCNGGEYLGNDPEDMANFSLFDRNHQRQKNLFCPEMLQDLVQFGHAMGLKLCGTVRTGSWAMGFPAMYLHSDNPFYLAHPEYRCIDRDGQPFERLSYAYPEVRQYMIQQLLFMARQGFDAVGPLFNRGQPHALYESPVVERFRALYGEDPYELPLEDTRLNAVHCEFVTAFLQELREALDTEFGKGRIPIHAWVMNTLRDCRLNALDPEGWCKLGVVDVLVSYPRAMFEVLPDGVWKDEAHTRIDMVKYREFVRTYPKSTVLDDYEFDGFVLYETPPDTAPLFERRCMTAQISRQRVAEFMELEKKYGVQVYFDIMPRSMSQEDYRDFVLKMYNLGAQRFTLWDTNARVSKPALWSMVRRLGHREQLTPQTSFAGKEYRYFKLLSVAGRNEYRFKSHWGS